VAITPEELDAWLLVGRKYALALFGFIGLGIQLLHFATPPFKDPNLYLMGLLVAAVGSGSLPSNWRPSA
jgi:hypothetical protein